MPEFRHRLGRVMLVEVLTKGIDNEADYRAGFCFSGSIDSCLERWLNAYVSAE